MATLLLRLAAPLQSWGVESKFEIRRTEHEPTKSGVIGLLAAALGRSRFAELDDLVELNMAVRVDQSGELLQDFHTARNEKTSYITTRFYLADAVFLVGLENKDEDFVKQLDYALSHPAFPLFLGRRSCPPTLPITLGLRQRDLLTALTEEPWLAQPWRQRKLQPELRMLSDAKPTDMGIRHQRDLPLSFSPMNRRYAFNITREQGYTESKLGVGNHDPMAELR